MDKVVILARASTDKQEFNRQVVELQEYCNHVGWQVEKVFPSRISGTAKIEDQAGVMGLVEYVRSNDVTQ